MSRRRNRNALVPFGEPEDLMARHQAMMQPPAADLMLPMMPFDDIFENMHSRVMEGMVANMNAMGFGSMMPSLFDMPGTMMNRNVQAASSSSIVGGIGSPNTGSYHSEVMMMSTSIGPDGQPHVEKYASTTAGNADHRIRETKEAFTSTRTGIDKMALERQMGDKARRVVKQRNRTTGDEEQDDQLLGVQEGEVGNFDNEWRRQQEHLPRVGPSRMMMDFARRDPYAIGAPPEARRAIGNVPVRTAGGRTALNPPFPGQRSMPRQRGVEVVDVTDGHEVPLRPTPVGRESSRHRPRRY